MAKLAYLRKANDIVAAHLADQNDVPAWVQTLIAQSAQAMGMAVAYTRRGHLTEEKS